MAWSKLSATQLKCCLWPLLLLLAGAVQLAITWTSRVVVGIFDNRTTHPCDNLYPYDFLSANAGCAGVDVDSDGRCHLVMEDSTTSDSFAQIEVMVGRHRVKVN